MKRIFKEMPAGSSHLCLKPASDSGLIKLVDFQKGITSQILQGFVMHRQKLYFRARDEDALQFNITPFLFDIYPCSSLIHSWKLPMCVATIKKKIPTYS